MSDELRPGFIRVRSGINNPNPLPGQVGKTVAELYRKMREILNLSPEMQCRVNNTVVDANYLLCDGDVVEWVRPLGEKAGPLYEKAGPLYEKAGVNPGGVSPLSDQAAQAVDLIVVARVQEAEERLRGVLVNVACQSESEFAAATTAVNDNFTRLEKRVYNATAEAAAVNAGINSRLTMAERNVASLQARADVHDVGEQAMRAGLAELRLPPSAPVKTVKPSLLGRRASVAIFMAGVLGLVGWTAFRTHQHLDFAANYSQYARQAVTSGGDKERAHKYAERALVFLGGMGLDGKSPGRTDILYGGPEADAGEWAQDVHLVLSQPERHNIGDLPPPPGGLFETVAIYPRNRASFAWFASGVLGIVIGGIGLVLARRK